MKNIKTGVGKPKETDKETITGKVIEYGVTVPSSGFDKRADQGKAGYVGESKMESRSSKCGQGHAQSKKHPSTGKGQ